MANMQVEHRVVLITGGAKGIGRAIALELAKYHYVIVVNYLHSKDEAEQLVEHIKEKYKTDCLAIQADVAKEEEVDSMVHNIELKFGQVDILINNAAIDLANLFHLKTASEFRKILDVNVVGAYNCARRVCDSMKENKFGKIINIASTNGINTYFPMSFDYDASKAALISLTHNLAWQCAPYVNVNAIAPGFIGTASELDGYDDEFLKAECEKIMLKRYGQPEEVAKLVRFLISDDAKYINNSVIRIDGGQIGSV